MSRVAKKPDFVTISIYAVLAVFVIYFAASLGACFDLSTNEEGKVDFDNLANSLETTIMDTELVFEQVKAGGNAVMFPVSTAFGIGLYALMKVTGKNKFHRKGEEHGSSRWANKKEIASLLDKPPKKKKGEKNPRDQPKPKKGEFVMDNNIILTNDVKMSLNTRQTRKNLNVMVIGGSGSGKSRFYVKPNLMQANTSYVCTDPKGELLRSTGKMLESYGYKIKVFNLIDMAHSHNYNPFNYIYDVDGNYSATAVIKMVNVLIKNTSKDGGGGGDQFWDDSTKALLAALCFYLVECEDKSMQNFSEVMKLLKKAEVMLLKIQSYEQMFKLFFKFILAKVIVQNARGIMGILFNGFNSIAETLGETNYGFLSSFNTDAIIAQPADAGFLNLNYLMKYLEAKPTFLILMGACWVINLILIGRLFEIIVYTVISPIPLATFAGEGWHDSAKAFIKSYAAVCLQWLVVIVMFYAFSQVAELLGGTDSMGITITALALALGVAKSGQWARQAVGA